MGGTLTGVWESGARDLYAVGDQGMVLHFDGASWTKEATGTTASLTAIWGSGADDVYAVGMSDGGRSLILHRSRPGDQWQRDAVGTTSSLSALWGSSPKDVFAAGEKGTVVHFDGHDWSAQSTGSEAEIVSLWGSGPKDVYAVGYIEEDGPERGVVLHYDGLRWKEQSTVGSRLRAVWGSGTDNVLLAGAEEGEKVALWRRASSGWVLQKVPEGAGWLAAMSGVDGHAVALGMTEWDGLGHDSAGMRTVFALEEKGDTWRRRDLLTGSAPMGERPWALWGDGMGPAAVAGVWGTIGHLDEKGLQVNGNVARGLHLAGVWGRSPADVYTVGDDGLVLHRDSQSWTVEPTGTHRNLTAVHGTSESVVACGRDGWLLVRDATKWQKRETGTALDLQAVWANGSHVFAGGADGTIVQCDVARCTATSLHSEGIFAIWGRSAEDVFAGGAKGTMFHLDGAGWKPQKLPDSGDVLAIGGDGRGGVIATTESRKGHTATYRLEGDRWSLAADGGSSSFFEMGDGLVLGLYSQADGPNAGHGVYQFDGTSWRGETLDLGSYHGEALHGSWGAGGEAFLVGYGGAILHKRK